MIMSAYPPSTRVQRPDMRPLIQRKNSAQIFPLVMWIPTISFAVGAHKIQKGDAMSGTILASRLSIYLWYKRSQELES